MATKKLVVYRDEETLRQKAGGYPCLVNFDAINKRGDLDDGNGNFGPVDFVTLERLPETFDDHDTIELIGLEIDDILIAIAKTKGGA